MGKEWGVGELEFEALMRMLDNSGFRTGFTYTDPLVRKEPARMANDVELPPTVSNLGFLMEEDELYKDSPLKGLLAQMARANRSTNKTKWVNSPNVYQKVEVLETGTTDPKKITKWVSEGSPSHSTPIKIESSNQFVPLNSNPKEFKKVQKLMKEGRRLGGVHAGPESKVLDGVSWEEARQMADAHPSAVGEPYGMKVGAASKGIIQRDFQHHATIFKSPYAKNPFDSVSNEELEEYKRIINKKNQGDSSPTSPVLEEDTIGDTTDPGLRDVEVSKQHAPQPTTPSKEFIGDDDADSQAEFRAALERSLSTRQPGREGVNNTFFERNTPRSKSLGRGLKGEHTNYEEETDGNRTFSEGEGDTSRATDPDSALSPKKEKKKKGLRTPSFLKKKKKDKKEKEKA